MRTETPTPSRPIRNRPLEGKVASGPDARPGIDRWIAIVMGFEAATLAVMSILHLTGILAGGSKPFDRGDAGIAEALICLALLAGATALIRTRPSARVIALATTGFAIVGFIVGLNFTLRGGNTIDIAYHATVLPLLVLTFGALL